MTATLATNIVIEQNGQWIVAPSIKRYADKDGQWSYLDEPKFGDAYSRYHFYPDTMFLSEAKFKKPIARSIRAIEATPYNCFPIKNPFTD